MTSAVLIEQFYNEYSDKYPDISLNDMKLICNAPFEMAKEVMQSGSLEDIRLQYLFVMRVSASRVMRHLKDIYSKKAVGNINEQSFIKYRSILLNHINKNPKKFLKYETQIKKITGESVS